MKSFRSVVLLGCVGLAGTSGWSQVVQGGVGAAGPVSVAAADASAKALAAAQVKLADWPQLGRYQADNAALPVAAAGEQRVVFYGDSITDAWGRSPAAGEFFPGKPYVNRGISGQTTAQMVVRFEQDVVHLKPAVVVILAGTNDVAGNTGPMTEGMTEDNFEAMVAIAKGSGIKVVIASITPASGYPWKLTVKPAESIKALNAGLKAMCAREGLVYLDYYTPMTNAAGGLDTELALDGVHPTAKGYEVMAPLAEKAIAEALAK